MPADHHAGEIEIRSLALMRDVRHPHLLSIFGAWRVGKLLVIASELAECTLFDRFTEASAATRNRGFMKSE